jgi:Zn-dependent M28 family amino/carboxypeptidase
VRALSVEIGERNVGHPRAYAAAADWTASQLLQAGLQVHEESYTAGQTEARNLVGEIAGAGAKDQIVIVGAHYDSVEGTPGANDNASGIAALLALARHFARSQPQRTLRFVAFANEEPPFFQTEQMGSLVYARRCAARHENVVAMLSLETMGYYSDAPNSQHYPFPFSLLYPSTGNFLAFVGNLSSQALTRDAVRTFRRAGKLPAEGAAVADVVPGIGWSDHWSLWRTGVPAVMVTDTAPFRYAQYHEETDTPEKLDYDRLARAVVGLADVIEELSRAK